MCGLFNIYCCWLLLAVPALAALQIFGSSVEKKTIRKRDERFVKEPIRTYSPIASVKILLVLVVFGHGVLALANLRKPGSVGKVNRNVGRYYDRT